MIATFKYNIKPCGCGSCLKDIDALVFDRLLIYERLILIYIFMSSFHHYLIEISVKLYIMVFRLSDFFDIIVVFKVVATYENT